MPAFHALHRAANLSSFYLVHRAKSLAVAAVHFHIDGPVARTPYKAPFGSLECSENIGPKVLYRFLENVQHRLQEGGAKDIFIKNPPCAYAPGKWALVETFLLNLGYAISEAEVSVVIPVRDKAFSEMIRHSEKLRWRQGKEAGFHFQNLALDRLEEVFQLIAACHAEKGYSLSITQAELERTAKVFPDRYVLSGVFQGEKIVAAAVSIRINEDVLYNFLFNHEKALNHLSPPVLLMEGIYTFCRQNSIRLMDLGTSALQGNPNFPLLDFKLRMGGVPASKFTFHKETV